MIFVARVEAPAILVRNSQAWTDAYCAAIKNLKTAPNDPRLRKAKLTAENKYKQKAIRIALGDKMFSGKCCYCESRIAHDQDPPIEHFRPKTKYPKLCFTWENLLWACGKCNGTEFKGDQFPLGTDGGPILNPTLDKPEKHLKFEYDDVSGTAVVGYKTKRGEVTRDLLGLNRNELLKMRSESVERIVYIASKAASGDPWALSILKKACQNPSPYAAFARAIADRFAIRRKA